VDLDKDIPEQLAQVILEVLQFKEAAVAVLGVQVCSAAPVDQVIQVQFLDLV
jgi:hypothetical protein